MSDRQCPDGGTCHHGCDVGCWRVGTCGPLSGVYEGDEWPQSVRDLPPALPPAVNGGTAGTVLEDGEPLEVVRSLVAAALGRSKAKRERGAGYGLVNITLAHVEVEALHRHLAGPPRYPREADRFAELAPSRLDPGSKVP